MNQKKLIYLDEETGQHWTYCSYGYNEENGTLVVWTYTYDSQDFKNHTALKEHHYTFSLKSRNSHETFVFVDDTKIKIYTDGITIKSKDFNFGKALDYINATKRLVEHGQRMIREFKTSTGPCQLLYMSTPIAFMKEFSSPTSVEKMENFYITKKNSIDLNVVYATDQKKITDFIEVINQDTTRVNVEVLDSFEHVDSEGEKALIAIIA